MAVGAGALMLGIGSLFSAFGGGGEAPQLSPEMQAALQQQRIDNEKFGANMAAAMAGLSLPYEQEMARYPTELQAALGNAYTKYYGGMEKAAITAAEKAFAGEMTPATKNLITAYSANVAGQKIAARNALKANIAAAGMDMSSPEAQAILAQQEASMSSSLSKGTADIAFQAGQQDIQNALKTLQLGQTSDRLAGMENPNIPQTGTERLLAPLMNEINALNEQLRSGTAPTAQRLALTQRLNYLNSQAQQIQSGNLFGSVQPTGTIYTPNLETSSAFGGSSSGPGTTNALSGAGPVFASQGGYADPRDIYNQGMTDYTKTMNMTAGEWNKMHPDKQLTLGRGTGWDSHTVGWWAANYPEMTSKFGISPPAKPEANPYPTSGVSSRYSTRT